MPLTPSHAAVAPLLQRLIRPLGVTVPMSALVIGSMTPDFLYLIRLNPGGGAWHTPLGLVEFCLPAGLATWWIFRLLIGPALLRLLPPALGEAARARVAPGPTYRLVPAALVAILLGVVSHDLWDGFTHRGGWGVQHIPWLRHVVWVGATTLIRYYLILQYVSSVIGLIVAGAILWRWVSAQPLAARHVPAGQLTWRVRDLGLLLSSGVLGAVMNVSRTHPSGFTWTLGFAAVGAMSALAIALFVYGILDWIRQRVAASGSIATASQCHEAGS